MTGLHSRLAALRFATLALAAHAALIGCGGEASEPRFEVVRRPDIHELRRDETQPLSRTWDFDGPAPGWSAPAVSPGKAAGGGSSTIRTGIGTEATLVDGALQLTGIGRLALTGPWGAARTTRIDPEVHHWLNLRLSTTTARSMTLAWRGAGQSFEPGRTASPIKLHPDGEWHTYSLPLSELRGSVHANDGVEAFLLRFDGPGKLAVKLDQIALLSDFDVPVSGSRALSRNGVLRKGAAVPLPGGVRLTLDLQPGDRLNLALAVAGAEKPITILREIPSGGTPLPIAQLAPTDGWQDVSIEPGQLGSDPAGGPTTIVLRCDDDAGPLATLLVGSALQLRAAPGPAPDVLLYVVDTLRADRLSLYGHDRGTDPRLSAIAAEGAVFEQVLAASNWTRPSMSSLLTSLDPLAHGNQIHGRRVPESAVTLAETFAEAGWRTAAYVTNFHAGDWAGLAQGFDVHAGPRHKRAYQLESTQTSDLVADWLDSEWATHVGPQAKTFVMVLALDPHAPYRPTPDDLAAVATGARTGTRTGAPTAVTSPSAALAYDAEVFHNDANLGRLDATLARLGRSDDTLLVITADHGEAFGEHGHDEHRRSLHQEEVRVPWVLRWPGSIPAGTRLDAPVSHLDMAPTLLGLVGVTAPSLWQGSDLSAWLRGTGPAPPPDRPVFSDAVYLPSDRPAHPHELAIVVSPYKLITRVEADGLVRPHALFDLAADPGERHNRVRDAALSSVLLGLLAQVRDLVARGRILPEQGSISVGMDPEMLRWMQAMGYL